MKYKYYQLKSLTAEQIFYITLSTIKLGGSQKGLGQFTETNFLKANYKILQLGLIKNCPGFGQ